MCNCSCVECSHCVQDDDVPNWERNEYQFPRLLSEIRACVELNHNDLHLLCESMDISQQELSELFDRAQASWEYIKLITT